VGYSFDITIDAPRVWSISGHYGLTTAGRFCKKCQKFCRKMPKNRLWGILSEAKCCSLGVQQTNYFLETNSICMDFICLQWLAAGILSGRNNGLLSCYVEFTVRAKTGFSYILSSNMLVRFIFDFFFEVVFEPHGGTVSFLNRPEIVSGGSKLSRPEKYSFFPAI